MKSCVSLLKKYGLESTLPKGRKVYMNFEIIHRIADKDMGRGVEELKMTLLYNYIRGSQGFQIANADVFKEQMGKMGRKIKVADWKLKLLKIAKKDHYPRTYMQFEENDLERNLLRIIEIDRKQIEKESPEFCLKLVFDKEKAIEEMLLELQFHFETIVYYYNKSTFLENLKEELCDDLWKQYVSETKRNEVV